MKVATTSQLPKMISSKKSLLTISTIIFSLLLLMCWSGLSQMTTLLLRPLVLHLRTLMWNLLMMPLDKLSRKSLEKIKMRLKMLIRKLWRPIWVSNASQKSTPLMLLLIRMVWWKEDSCWSNSVQKTYRKWMENWDCCWLTATQINLTK